MGVKYSDIQTKNTFKVENGNKINLPRLTLLDFQKLINNRLKV